jgi:hypothetical protein
MIANRFSNLGTEFPLKKGSLTRKWWHSKEIQNITGKAKWLAVMLWIMLSYSPKPVVKYIMNRNIQRAKDPVAG